jgi:hypothetical protein
MKEALQSSETSVLTRATRHNIPEDAILHSHRHENLKFHWKLSDMNFCLRWSSVTPCISVIQLVLSSCIERKCYTPCTRFIIKVLMATYRWGPFEKLIVSSLFVICLTPLFYFNVNYHVHKSRPLVPILCQEATSQPNTSLRLILISFSLYAKVPQILCIWSLPLSIHHTSQKTHRLFMERRNG